MPDPLQASKKLTSQDKLDSLKWGIQDPEWRVSMKGF